MADGDDESYAFVREEYTGLRNLRDDGSSFYRYGKWFVFGIVCLSVVALINWRKGPIAGLDSHPRPGSFSKDAVETNVSWDCMDRPQHIYSDEWCKLNPVVGDTQYKFFGADSPCGHCWCCSHSLKEHWVCGDIKEDYTDEWCKENPVVGQFKHRFFGPNSPCGSCHCCKTHVGNDLPLEVPPCNVEPGWCAEGLAIEEGGVCTPLCDSPSYPSEQALTCHHGELEPRIYECKSRRFWFAMAFLNLCLFVMLFVCLFVGATLYMKSR